MRETLHRIAARIRAHFGFSRIDAEVDTELELHLAMSIEDYIRRGMTEDEARRNAQLDLGPLQTLREEHRETRGLPFLDTLAQDLRYAFRVFLRSPGFSLIVVTTLALGIGANTAIFEIVNAVRLRTLPIPNPGELVELRIAGGNPTGIGVKNDAFTDFTMAMWQEVKEHHDPFSGIFAWATGGANVGPPGQSRQVNGLAVTGDFFNVLGVAPVQGRLIEPQDERGCQTSGAVASYSFWQSQMGGEPITPNTTIIAAGQPVRIIGVTPPSFFGMVVGDRFDVAYPACTPPNMQADEFVVTVMGRLKPGWTLKQATEYFDALSPGLFRRTAPTGYSAEALKIWKAFRLAAYPAGAGVSYLRDQYNSSLEILLAITGLVLLIACANLANLMLARASAKRREGAIRIALGASRGRLLRQILLESALLAACGAILGAAFAQPLSRALVSSLDTSQNTVHLAMAPDWRVLLFAAAAGIATCVLFAAVPALRSTGEDPVTSLKSGARGVVGNRERFSLQRAMVITQIAVSMVLLVGALLFVRSYRNLVTLNPGIRENNITIGYFGFPSATVKMGNLAQLVDAVRAIPGVENAAATTRIPLSGQDWSHVVEVGAVDGSSKFTYVSPTFFATMGIPLLEGRNFTEYDTNGKPFVLIVNQAFVRKYVSGLSHLGVQVHVRPEPLYPARTYQIVAVIPDTKYADLRADPPPQAFVPVAQLPVMAQNQGMAIVIASRAPLAAQSAVRRMLDVEHPDVQMGFSDFQQGILDRLVGDRMMARLAAFFGVLAALLVVVGLHGLLSYFLAQRRSEIGIRMALGASRGRVVAAILGNACLMLGIGLVAGTALALLAGRGASTLLFGLKSWDPATLAGAAALLALVTVVASVVPSLRAANVNPIDSLRAE
jgi:predicted permease